MDTIVQGPQLTVVHSQPVPQVLTHHQVQPPWSSFHDDNHTNINTILLSWIILTCFSFLLALSSSFVIVLDTNGCNTQTTLATTSSSAVCGYTVCLGCGKGRYGANTGTGYASATEAGCTDCPRATYSGSITGHITSCTGMSLTFLLSFSIYMHDDYDEWTNIPSSSCRRTPSIYIYHTPLSPMSRY